MVAKASCPSGWVASGSNCYLATMSAVASSAAVAECQAQSPSGQLARLASFADDSDLDAVTASLGVASAAQYWTALKLDLQRESLAQLALCEPKRHPRAPRRANIVLVRWSK